MASTTSRKMIAALQISLDGFTQGPDRGEPEWVDSWADALQLVPDVGAFVQGAGMYPGYGEYWKAIHENPASAPPYQDRLPTKREIAYAELAARTPHHVLSRTLQGVSWPPTARIVRDVVGGPTLVRTLLREGLIDELRLIVHPIVLGGGKALFEGLDRHLSLKLVSAESTKTGRVILTYRT
jgi:RibD C-terminal domain